MITNNTQRENIMSEFSVLPDLSFYIEQGDESGKTGNHKAALDWYMRGLNQAKRLKDRARIQQFANLILNYI